MLVVAKPAGILVVPAPGRRSPVARRVWRLEESDQTGAFAVESYAPEYRAAVADRSFLEQVAKTTRGKNEPPPTQPFVFEGDPARGLRDLWRLCALLTALLLPLDIALRRLG